MERPADPTTRSASLATALAGLGLFVVPFVASASDVAVTLEASFAALVAVLGHDLLAAARRGSAPQASQAWATAEVIRISTLAYLAAALVDWSLHSIVDVPALISVLALAGMAIAGAHRAARGLTRRLP